MVKNEYTCPICNHSGQFLEYGSHKRENALCPICSSLERYRGISLLLNDLIDQNLNEKKTVLHVGPEISLHRYFTNKDNIDYFPVDIDPNHYGIRHVIDISCMPYPSNYFDIIVCYNVLEEVKNDKDALDELYRVLNNQGKLILNPPSGRNKTAIYKDNNPKMKKIRYTPGKKYREYGIDLIDILSLIGYNSSVIKMSEIASNVNIKKYGLLETESILLCEKRELSID